MNKKKLTKLFIEICAGVLVILALIASIQAGRPAETATEAAAEPVVIAQSEAPEAEVVALAPAEETPPPQEALPATAVTLLVNRQALFTLSSENAMQALLNNYLSLCAVAPESERFLSASFDAELIIVPVEADAHLTGYDDALSLLVNTPEAVPVVLMTEKTSETEADYETTTAQDAALALGSRMITQLGTKASVQTLVKKTYVAGELKNESAPETVSSHESRTMILRVGTWTSSGDSPARLEGKKGRDAGELTFVWPMRGSVSSYFGMRSGQMHNGVDVTGSAGTAIVAPAEGLVVYSGPRGAYGWVVDIDHGNGFMSRITHLEADSVQVKLGQRVFAGDPLGTLAASENDSKPHLHYELWIDSVPYNPVQYLP